MQRLQQPQDAACVGEAGADRRVQVLDSRQSFQAGRIGDFQYLAEGFQGRTDRLHHQLVFVPVLGAVQQGLSEPRIFLGIAAAGDGPGQGMGECLAGANADQAFREAPRKQALPRRQANSWASACCRRRCSMTCHGSMSPRGRAWVRASTTLPKRPWRTLLTASLTLASHCLRS